MKRSTKKGFTIVELVIVIAIIAILAAVLIPTFASLIQKANVSKDTQLVRNLNTALVADNAEHKTMQSALDAAAAFGYDVGKINASAMGNEILWDSRNDVFCYLKDGNVEHIPETVLKVAKDDVKPYDYWQICTKVPDTQKYSIYWNNETAPNFGEKNLTVGFDAGKCNAIDTLTYTGGTNQDVVIRTNGGTLVVNAPSDHVEHYGLAKVVEVKAVSEATYVEHGTVAKMTLAENAKNVIIKSTAVVVKLDTSSPKVAIEGDAYVGAVEGTSAANVSGTHGGDTIKVGTYDQLQALALASTLEIKLTGKTIELTADIDLTGKVWTPFGFSKTAPFDGIIDGKGHTIKGLSAAGYSFKEKAWITNTTNGNQGPAYGFVCIAKDATIKNLKFTDVNIDVANGLAIGAVVGDARGSSLTIENVTVDGSVKAMDKVGGFVGLAGYNESTNFVLTIGNSVNNADVVAVCGEKYNRAGGFVGGLGGSACFTNGKVEFVSCTNNGNVTVTGHETTKDPNNDNVKGLIVMAGGFIGAVNGDKTITVTSDCTNTGTITVKNTMTNGTKTVTGMNEGGQDDTAWVKAYPMYAGDNVKSSN